MLAEMTATEFTEWQAYLALDGEYREALNAGLTPHNAWHLVFDPPKES
jgi:hypothetical protein